MDFTLKSHFKQQEVSLTNLIESDNNWCQESKDQYLSAQLSNEKALGVCYEIGDDARY